MDLKITKLANLEAHNSKEFLTKVDSKLMIDVKKNRVVENEEWLNMIEFTIPYIEKALITDTFTAELKYSSSSYTVGDTLASFDQLPSNADVIAYFNSNDVTNLTTTNIVITDPNGNIVTSIDGSVVGTFTIVYTITYQGNVQELSRTITINE